MARGRELASARVASLAGYVPGEQPTDRNLVKLNTNENPYPCSPRVGPAVAAEVGMLARYPSPMADALRAKAAEVYGVRPTQVLAGNGSDELLALLLRTCCVAGDRVAWPAPTYSLYRVLADLAGLVAIEVAADAAQVIPPGVLAADAKVNFLCTPNSPSGKPLPLDAIAAFARAARGLVVVDEAYVDFGGASALAILQDHPNMVVTRSFSKSFSLAGLRLGLLFGHEDFVAELEKGKDSYNVSRLAAAAGVAALEDIDWMRANVAKVCATRQRVADELRRRGYAPAESSANFLWVDCKAQGGGRPVYERLRQGSVLVRYFASLPDGFRVTIGTDAEMDRFLAVLDGR